MRLQQRRQRLSVARHILSSISAVRDATEAVLLSMGLDRATYTVADGGRSVAVTVAREDACTLSRGDAAAIARRVLNAQGLVRQVAVRVRGSILPLEVYLKRRCAQAPVRTTTGRPVFRTSGTGITQTPEIRVSGKSWRLAYTSSSAFLQIYVYRGGKLDTVAVNRRGRGRGTKVLEGSGSFRLQVAATGQWSLRVYGNS